MATTKHSDLEQQIIKAAQQLFIERGFVETSVSSIVVTVGVNRPILHYYFGVKDRMLKAAFGSMIVSLMPKIQGMVKQDIPFIERLNMTPDGYIKLFTSNPCLPRFIRGEIQRDVNHLLTTAKGPRFGDVLSQARSSILTAMEDSKLKRVPIHIIFLTVYNLLSYPFLAENPIVPLFLEDETVFADFLQEWKQNIIN